MKHLFWALLGVFIAVAGIYVTYTEYSLKTNAIETSGVVSKRPTIRQKGSPLNRQQVWHISYQFEVAGVKYTNDAELGNIPEELKDHWWREGDLPNPYYVRVYYDPHDISNNALEKPTGSGIGWNLLFLVLLFGWVFLEIRAFMLERKRKLADSSRPEVTP